MKRTVGLILGAALFLIGIAILDRAPAQISPLPGSGPIPFSSKIPPSISFQTDTFNASPSSNAYTYTSQAIGAANSTRIVAVLAHTTFSTTGAVTAASSTIGGVTTTLIKDQINGSEYIALLVAAVPTGTTATIVIQYNAATQNRSCIGVWSMLNLANAGTASTTTASTANPLSLNMNTLIGDIIIAGHSSATVGNNGATYTGATRRYDIGSTGGPGTGDACSGGDFTTVASESPRTISINGETSASPAGIAAIFR